MPIRLLMVTDAEGCYTAQGERFGLTELVTALEEGGCDVTKAHRWTTDLPHTAGADIAGFRFTTNFEPDAYDEVWLMGFASQNLVGPYKDKEGFELTATEIERLAEFMNGGGGVFATGDHDDLGADLCGQVPRVRSMRRWTADYGWSTTFKDNPDAFVPSPTSSPPPLGRYRLDTVVSGHNAHFEFQDQSDDVPQRIDPVMRVVREHISHTAGGQVGFRESVPHPLLCSSDGVIDVLPDHMHEGRCVVPTDLTGQFTIDGSTHDEYPPLAGGARVSPEVVAWATVRGRMKDPDFVDPTETASSSNATVAGDYFPVIVAYNGHRAHVGRVAVDSTFHHFVNINVTGVKADFPEADAADAVKEVGFLASPEGKAHYARIKAYWVNIARWLAPPPRLVELAWPNFLRVAMDPRVKQTALGDADRVPSKYVVRHGAAAWTAFTERVSPCTVLDFIFDVAIPDPLSYLLSHSVYVKLTLPDPGPDERIRQDLAVDRLELAYYALATAVTELRKPENRDLIRSGRLDAAEGMRIVQAGARAGLQRGMNDQAARMERTLRALKATIARADAMTSADRDCESETVTADSYARRAV